MARDLQAILKANLEQTDEVESPKTVVQMPKQPQPNVDEKRSRFAAMMTEGRAPVGAMGAALENMKGQSEAEISALKAQIESGQTIVEIETDKIDRSFVSDRMDESDDALTSLKEQIKKSGANCPHPCATSSRDRGAVPDCIWSSPCCCRGSPGHQSQSRRQRSER